MCSVVASWGRLPSDGSVVSGVLPSEGAGKCVSVGEELGGGWW